MFKIIGADPGWASIGLATVSLDNSKYKLISTSLIETEPMSAKERIKKDIRVSKVDDNRLQELYSKVYDYILSNKPDLVGIEAYCPFGWSGHNSWKTSIGVTIIKCVCITLQIPFVTIRPQDVKKFVAKNVKASKVDIQVALESFFDEPIDYTKYNKNSVEHISDAIGIGLTVSTGDFN